MLNEQQLDLLSRIKCEQTRKIIENVMLRAKGLEPPKPTNLVYNQRKQRS